MDIPFFNNEFMISVIILWYLKLNFSDIINSILDITNSINDIINSILDITNSINDIMNSFHDINKYNFRYL